MRLKNISPNKSDQIIAKAATISHSGNAVRYSVNKDKAEIVKVHFLPDGVSAEAMYQRMVFKQKKHEERITRMLESNEGIWIYNH